MDDVRRDLAGTSPMLRLLQGDVGSGKTAVAAYALAAAARAGFQGALLAPTDLLARQHLETVGALLADLGIDVLLLAGSLKAAQRTRALEAIASGQASVIVGTTRSSRTPFGSLGWAWPSSTSSTASGWTSAGPWRRRRAWPPPRTSCS